ncbi:MAG: hypothetical protein AAF721_18360 [Myxococcota bacterium]
MHRSVLAGAVLATAPFGCQASVPDDQPPVFRVELAAINQYAEPAGTQNGVAGYAESARGGLLVPQRDGNGNQRHAADGTPIRASCGAIMVSPSYAVTAAHCVSEDDVPNPATDVVTLEMYTKDPALQSGYLTATNLTTASDWLDFQHPQLAAQHGYHPERFDCHVAVRCGDDWGNHNCAPLEPKADVAVVRCDGKPGNIYGHVNIADDDLDDVPVFMPWAHEVYAINGQPGDDLFFDHYTFYDGDKSDNLHYFGDDRNQLVPLRSIPLPGSSESSKHNYFPAPPNEYRRWTDLAGCHGTSGSPVLQPDPNTGLWELLGPAINPNGPAWNNRLCADPGLVSPGQATLAYGALRLTKHAIADVDDCEELTDGKGIWFHTWCWLKRMEWIEFQPIPEPWPCLSCPPFLQLRIFGEPLARIGEQPVQLPMGIAEGVTTRLALVATSLEGGGGLELLDESGRVVLEAEIESEGYTVLSAVLDRPVGGSLYAASLGSEVGITQVQLAASERSNGFDDAIDRLGVGVLALEELEAAPAPMTFEADGEGGFAAQLAAGQRMVATRSALVADRSWEVAFTAKGTAELNCGFVLDDGEEVSQMCDIEDGLVRTEFDTIDGTPVAFFVDGVDVEGTVAIDDLSLIDAG